MPRNPFTSESRDHVATLDNGVITKLRVGDTLRQRIVAGKPQHQGLGDFALKAMYDAILIADIVAGRYDVVHATLAADWGLGAHARSEPATSVAEAHKRSNGAAR